MAGHYYYDPRPFYDNRHTGLMPLDELFYGRYEPIPYWQDQRMAPLSMFEDNYYMGPGLKQQQMVRRPEIMQQQYVPQRGENNFMPYKRPELVRDDIYTDMYRRSPYNFNYNNYGRDGVAVAPGMHPEVLRQQQPRQAQDDTWVHAMSAPSPFGHGGFRGLPEPPPGVMPNRNAFGTGNGTGNGNGNGNDQYRPMANGSDQYQMNSHNQSSHNHNQSSHNHNQSSHNHNQSSLNHNQSSLNHNQSSLNHNQSSHNHNQSSHNNNSNGNSNSNNHGNGNSKQSMGVSSQQNGSFATQGKSLGQGGKSGAMQTSTMSKQLTGSNNNYNSNSNNYSNSNGNGNSKSNAKRYNDDSSSDSDSDDDDEYRNNGGNWSTVKSGTKHGHSSGKATSAHGHKGDSHSHGYQSNSKNSSQSMSGSKKLSSSHSYGSSGKHSSGGKHGSSQSTISKLLRLKDDSSSSEDDYESYGHGHSKKGSSNKGSHGSHGSHVSSFQSNSYASQPKKMQFSSQSKFVELKVPICCDNCERKVQSCLEKMDGVESVLCDQWNKKVIVYGNLKAENVLKRVRRVKKTSELWQHAKQPQQQLQQLRLY